MANYDIFSKYYDFVMTEYKIFLEIIEQEIKSNHPQAKSILEIACGTGNILKHFKNKYDIYGLDLSSEMLKIAKGKIPGGIFYHKDMINFKLDISFDVILCIFDSINHVINYKDWQKIFKNVKNHLNDKGIFIFDINTIEKLNKIINYSCLVKEFNRNMMIMKIKKIGENLTNWNVKFFEKINENNYKLFEENIKEISFGKHIILKDLNNYFNEVKIHEIESGGRIFFTCRV